MPAYPKGFFYPILNVGRSTPFSVLTERLTMWQDCKLSYYQLRAKDLRESQYLELAKKLKFAFPKLLIIANDFFDHALSYPEIFGGLHLGQKDFNRLSQAERILLEQKSKESAFILGLSTHQASQIKAVLERQSSLSQWSYLALGPCFSTRSKKKGLSPILQEGDFQEAILAFLECKYKKMKLALIGGIRKQNVSILLARVKNISFQGLSFLCIAVIEAAKRREEILSMQKIRESLKVCVHP